jgi:hypothetical protein
MPTGYSGRTVLKREHLLKARIIEPEETTFTKKPF